MAFWRPSILLFQNTTSCSKIAYTMLVSAQICYQSFFGAFLDQLRIGLRFDKDQTFIQDEMLNSQILVLNLSGQKIQLEVITDSWLAALLLCYSCNESYIYFIVLINITFGIQLFEDTAGKRLVTFCTFYLLLQCNFL